VCDFLEYASTSLSMFDQDDEPIVRDSRIALKTYDAEERMQLGIYSYQWIERVEAGLRAAHLQGQEVAESDFEAVSTWYHRWHERAERT
jgi:hypothetical protein